MNMSDKPAPAALECQSDIDKDLVRSYYGDIEAFYRVRAALAATPAVGEDYQRGYIDGVEFAMVPATPAVGGEAVAVVRQMVEAYDSGNLQMSSPEIGEPENDIPIHPWHEELLHYARAALAAQPAYPLRGRDDIARIIDPTAFSMRPEAYGLETEQEMLRETMVGPVRLIALRKADAILALVQSASPLRGTDNPLRAYTVEQLQFELAIRATWKSASPPEQPAPFQPHENCNCLMCIAEKPRDEP